MREAAKSTTGRPTKVAPPPDEPRSETDPLLCPARQSEPPRIRILAFPAPDLLDAAGKPCVVLLALEAHTLVVVAVEVHLAERVARFGSLRRAFQRAFRPRAIITHNGRIFSASRRPETFTGAEGYRG